MQKVCSATAKIALVVTLLALPALSSAQPRPAKSTSATASIELIAEHQQWEKDHRQWAAEHVALANRLRAIADAIAAGDDGLAQHGGELDTHGTALAENLDTAPLAARHAQLRSDHENARIAHHELIDAVRNLEQIARDDKTSRTSEVKASEPPR
jgi:hypothetical protein